MEKLKQYVAKNAVPLAILIFAYVYLAFNAVRMNPDSDSYFLINNGRYVIEHGWVPYVNPWNVTEGMGIIMQQWLCSVVNYFAFMVFGLNGMWIAALLLNLVFIAALAYFCRVFSQNSGLNLLVIAIIDAMCGGFITTRPYQMTMSISFFMLGMFFRMFRKLDETNGKERRILACKTALFAGLFAMLQANYQLAFFPMLLVWPLCFVAPGMKELNGFLTAFCKEKKSFRESMTGTITCLKRNVPVLLMIWVAEILMGLLNPYGLDGLLYLVKSSSVMSVMYGKINEVSPLFLKSGHGLQVLLGIILIVLMIRDKAFTSKIFYLSVGGLILAQSVNRNSWLILPGCIAMILTYCLREESKIPKFLTKLETNDKKGRKRIAIEFAIVIAILTPAFLPYSDTQKNVEDSFHYEAAKYLTDLNGSGAQIKLFTDFNTGNQMEFAGLKVYFDARPEIYAKEITGNVDQFQEWYDVFYTVDKDFHQNLKKFYLEKEFTHFEVECGGNSDMMMSHDDDFVEISRTEKFVLFERADFQP